MSFDNRHKIHVARGINENLVRSSALQSAGQPVFNKDKHYLSIANGEEGGSNTLGSFKDVVPLRARTVEGWLSDKETFGANSSDTFELSTENTGHYRFTGEDNDGDKKVYLLTNPDFYLYRETSEAPVEAMYLKADTSNKDFIGIGDNIYFKTLRRQKWTNT